MAEPGVRGSAAAVGGGQPRLVTLVLALSALATLCVALATPVRAEPGNPRSAVDTAASKPSLAPPGWQQRALTRGTTTGPSGQGTAMAFGEDGSGQGIAFVSNGGGEVLIYGENSSGAEEWGLAYTLPNSALSNSSDHFGWALAFAGGYLVVGDPNAGGRDDCGNRAGAVAVYQLGSSLSQWTFVTSFTVDKHYNNLGSSVAIDIGSSGSWVMAGAPGANDCRFISIKGASEEFAAIWNLADPSASPAQFDNHLLAGSDGADTGIGRAVAIDDGLAFVSAPDGVSVCMIYDKGSTGSWTWNGCMQGPVEAATTEYFNDTYGQSIAYSASTGQLLIGVPDNSYYSCSIYLCQNPGGQGGTNTTNCYYLPGEVLVMSAPAGWSSAAPSGGLPSWIPTTLTPSGISGTQKTYTGNSSCPHNDWRGLEFKKYSPEGAAFGQSVALDADGTTAIIGMPETDLPSGSGLPVNTAYAYSLDGQTNIANQQGVSQSGFTPTPPFFEQGTFVPDGIPADAQYGAAVAIYDTSTGVGQVGVGAPNQAAGGSNGDAYLFFDAGQATVGVDLVQTDPAPPVRPIPGSVITFQGTVSATTAADPINLQVEPVPVDPPFQVVSITPISGVTSGWSCVVGCTYTAGAYPAGSSTTFEIKLNAGSASPGQTYPLYLLTGWDNPTGAMDYASSIIHMSGDAALTVDIVQTVGNPVPPGGGAVYSVTVSNSSGTYAGNVALTIDGLGPVVNIAPQPSLPTVGYASGTNVPQWGCASPNAVPTCAVGDLAGNSSTTFTLDVAVSSGASIGTSFTPQAMVTWENPPNSEAVAQTTTVVGAGPPTSGTLTIVPVPDPPPTIGSLQTADSLVTLTNTGSTPMQAVAIQTSIALTYGVDFEIKSATLVANSPGWTCQPYVDTTNGPVFPSCSTPVMTTPDATFSLEIEVTSPSGNAVWADLTAGLRANASASWFNGAGSTPGSAASGNVDFTLGPIVPVQMAQQPATAQKGKPVTITVTMPNNGGDPVDKLDTAIGWNDSKFALTSGSLTASAGLSCRVAPSGTTIACSLSPGSTLAPGRMLSYSFTGTVADELVVFFREALVTIDQGDSDDYVLEELGGWNLTTALAADLQLGGDGEIRTPRGAVGHGHLDTANLGPGPAADVTYRFTPGAGLDLQTLTMPGGQAVDAWTLTSAATTFGDWSCSREIGGAVTCSTSAPLAAGATHQLDVGGAVSAGGSSAKLTAAVHAADDPDDTNNSVSLVFAVDAAPAAVDAAPAAGVARSSPTASATPTTTSGVLPATGEAAGPLLAIALGLIGIGSALGVASRRRAPPSTPPTAPSGSEPTRDRHSRHDRAALVDRK